MVSAFALALATQTAAPAEIPVASFRIANVLFVCSAPGLPSIRIDYDEMHREIDFGRYDQPVTRFLILDPIKSVTYGENGGAGRWEIRAEGPVRDAAGLVANGTQARIRLVLTRSADGRAGAADFTVEAGSFRQEGADCGIAPQPPRPGHGLPQSSSPGQSQ